MISLVAALTFGLFCITIICAFGIISAVSGLREINARKDPHWGFNYNQLQTKQRLTKLAVDLTISLGFSLILLLGCSVVAYHIMKGPIV